MLLEKGIQYSFAIISAGSDSDDQLTTDMLMSLEFPSLSVPPPKQSVND